MLKVFLWVTGILLCQTLTPVQYKSPNQNIFRRYLGPYKKPIFLNHFNYSTIARSNYPVWSPYRRFLKPSIAFNPYYKRKHPYIYLMPLSKQQPKIFHQVRKGRVDYNPYKSNYFISNESLTSSECSNDDDIKMVEFNDKLIGNDSIFHVSKNETMIISPSLLIGHKNKSNDNDDWIISNKPINIFIKKFPKNRTIIELKRYKNVSISTIGNQEMTNLENENRLDFYKSTLPVKNYELLSNGFSTPNKINDKLSDIILLSENTQISTSTVGNLITLKTMYNYPKKKKKDVSNKPSIYKIVDGLSSDDYLINNFKNVSKSKRDGSHNLKYEKQKIKQINKKIKNTKGKKCLKRSCDKSKREFTHDYSDIDYYQDFADSYDYNSGDNYTDENKNVYHEYLEKYLNDNIDRAESSCCKITEKPLSNEVEDFEEDSSYDLIEITASPHNTAGKCFFPDNYLKPKETKIDKNRIICIVNTPSRPIKKSIPLFNKEDVLHRKKDIFTTSSYSTVQIKDTYQCNKLDVIKNLTDELIEKVSLLTNLTIRVKDKEKSKLPLVTNYFKSYERCCTTGKNKFYNLPVPIMNTFKMSYEEEKPLLDSMFISPNKASCEHSSGRRCVCSPIEIINFFSNELQKSSETKILLKKLITYSCDVYAPIGVDYHIASDMKPRLISKKKRELIESDCGPKEIRPSIFDELLMRGIPKEGLEFYVFPSTTVEIPCFTSDEMKLSPNLADAASYSWSHSNLKAITEGRILEDVNHKGSLTIQDVTLGDSDNYTCSVTYIDPDTQNKVKRTFIHSIKVVVLPKLALHTNIHYCASMPCDQELLEMFELYLPQQIESYICNFRNCSLCSVEIHNPVCYTRNKKDSLKRSIDPRLLWRTDFQKSRWIREILNEDVQEMEMSLNYQLDLARVTRFLPESLNMIKCSPHCQQKIALKTIEILRDSFLDALMLPVITNSVYYEPSLDSINIRMLTACDGGLELKEGFCVPCKKHHYSEHGKTTCLPCPSGYYQDSIGAKSCIACPHPFRSNCFCLGTLKNLTAFFTAVVSVFLLILICWLSYSQLYGKYFAAKKVKEKKPDPLPPDFD